MNKEQIEELYTIFKAMAAAKHGNHIYLVRGFASIYGGYYKNVWRVVGITQEAYDAFKAVNFEKFPTRKDGVCIERAHLYQRNVWVKEMFERQWNSSDEWWQFVQDHDKTILATAAENKLSDQKGIPLKVAYEIPDTGVYFTSLFIGCKYRKKVEKPLLESFL
jgi:hypothetical protein